MKRRDTEEGESGTPRRYAGEVDVCFVDAGKDVPVLLAFHEDFFKHLCRGQPAETSGDRIAENDGKSHGLQSLEFTPQCPSQHLWRYLGEVGVTSRCLRSKTRLATDEELLRFHTRDYIQAIEGTGDFSAKVGEDCVYTVLGSRTHGPTLETFLCQHSAHALRLVTGSFVELVTEVATGPVKRGLQVDGRGHHSGSDFASGFGFYNEVGVAVRHAIDVLKLSRVLVVDLDVHVGDGIENALYEEAKAAYVSIHRYDEGLVFPGILKGSRNGHLDDTGNGAGAGHVVNIPWGQHGRTSKNTGDEPYREAFESLVLPIAREYNPELTIVFCGLDAAIGDPTGQCAVTAPMYGWMIRSLAAVGAQRIVVLLGGGNDPISGCEPGHSVAEALLDETQEVGPAPVSNTNFTHAAYMDLYGVLEVQKHHWSCLQSASLSWDVMSAMVDPMSSPSTAKDSQWDRPAMSPCQRPRLDIDPNPVTPGQFSPDGLPWSQVVPQVEHAKQSGTSIKTLLDLGYSLMQGSGTVKRVRVNDILSLLNLVAGPELRPSMQLWCAFMQSGGCGDCVTGDIWLFFVRFLLTDTGEISTSDYHQHPDYAWPTAIDDFVEQFEAQVGARA